MHNTTQAFIAPRVIAITSGKRGVGKTNTAINLAIALSRMGKRVLLFDAAPGSSGINAFWGIRQKYGLDHVLKGEKSIDELITTGPEDILVLAPADEVNGLPGLNRKALLTSFGRLEAEIDVMIIDTGRGFSRAALFFTAAAQEIIVVITNEPASVTDACTLIRVLRKEYGERRFRLLINKVGSEKHALQIYGRISSEIQNLPDVFLDYLGFVPRDARVPKVIAQNKALIEIYPHCIASECYMSMAEDICDAPAGDMMKGGIQFLWEKRLNRKGCP